jgi:dihydroneopterin aldolase
MDETASVFDGLDRRRVAEAAPLPLDRIALRDFTCAADIGAFRSERGRLQRLRFNVVLEVSRHLAARDDDVDKVISYDLITEAIETELKAERFNLLETLAERIAARCLADRRVHRAFVRVEKLDRVPGALGVEIVRQRLPEDTAVLPGAVRAEAPVPVSGPLVVYLPEAVLTGPALAAWIALPGPVVFCLPPMDRQPLPEGEAGRRMALLSVERAAWSLAGRFPALTVVDSRTELEWAVKGGLSAVWAPSRMVTAALGEAPEAPEDLARWLAGTCQARGFVSAAGSPPAPEGLAG